ncbi:MAG: CRTAC1 family protein [Verrucomicrobia bacterium]|nr:CRTAC1 family protein [Verrucomicrobiota bacterium]
MNPTPPGNRKSRHSGQSQTEDSPAREDFDPSSDAVIGRAFWWSVIVLLILGGAAGGLIAWIKWRAPAPSKITALTEPRLPEVSADKMPLAPFTDITSAARLRFVHNNGAYGDKLLPETMGSGVAFLDFDNDGDQDLLFVNSTYWPGKVPAGKAPATCALYRNDGTGHFDDVTAGSGLDMSFYGMGVAVGDYDNDELDDVFITALGQNRLFRNLGNGKFADVTGQAGVAGATEEWSASAAWIDLDNDGDLDLFVCNYVRWSREIDFEVDYRLVGIGRAYGPPMNFPGTFHYLYRNDGGGRFTDVSEQSGVRIKNPATGVPMAKSLGVAPVDINGDHWIDLVVANDTVQNFVFTNQHNGTFKEIGAKAGIAFDIYGQTRGAMGIDAARFRNDDALGIAIGNFANEPNALYVSQRDALVFADEAITEGVGPASRLLLKFGLFFFDYDLDGRLDVLTANGHLEEEISKVQQSQQYRQPAQLFWNSDSSRGFRYVPVPPERCGADIFKPVVGRGSAYADIDGDGDLDVVLTQNGGPPLLLRNDQQLGHRWLRLKLVGTRSNRNAIGAWVKVRVGNNTLSRQVMPTKGYLSQSELPITIGLGKAETAAEVVVTWPDGSSQKVDQVKIDSVNVIRQK